MDVLSNEKYLFPILAIVVLVIFYVIYFAKMLVQRRHGIQTRQIGRRKEKNIHTVELLMSFATLGAPIVQLLSIVLGWSYMPSGARFTGFCTGMLGDLIFLVSVICMKDSWRAGIPDKDKTELVTDGIYKFSRNPAFLGFDFMYIGVLLLYFNPLTAVFSLFAVVMLHLQILLEESKKCSGKPPPPALWGLVNLKRNVVPWRHSFFCGKFFRQKTKLFYFSIAFFFFCTIMVVHTTNLFRRYLWTLRNGKSQKLRGRPKNWFWSPCGMTESARRKLI